MIVKKIISVISSLFAITILSIAAFAITGDNDGGGNGTISGSGTWDVDQVGYRVSIVNKDGQQQGKSVDFVFSTPFSNCERLSTSNRVFGKYNYGGQVIIPLDSNLKGKGMPKPFIYKNGDVVGNGDAFQTWFKSNYKLIIDKKAFGLGDNLASKVKNSNWYIVIEPVAWYVPANYSNSTTYSKYIYGTAANIAYWYSKHTNYERDGGNYCVVTTPLAESMFVKKTGAHFSKATGVTIDDYPYYGAYVNLATLNTDLSTKGLAMHAYKDKYTPPTITYDYEYHHSYKTLLVKITGSSTSSDNIDNSNKTAEELYKNSKYHITSGKYSGNSGKSQDYSRTITGKVAKIVQTSKTKYTYLNGKLTVEPPNAPTSSSSYSRTIYNLKSKTIKYSLTEPVPTTTYYKYISLNTGDVKNYNNATNPVHLTVTGDLPGKLKTGEDKAYSLNVQKNRGETFGLQFGANTYYGVPNVGTKSPVFKDGDFTGKFIAKFDNGSGKYSNVNCTKTGIKSKGESLNASITTGCSLKLEGKSVIGKNCLSGITNNTNEKSGSFYLPASDKTGTNYYYFTNGNDNTHYWTVSYNQYLQYKYGVKYSGTITINGISNATNKGTNFNTKQTYNTVRQPIISCVFKSVSNKVTETEIETKKVIVKLSGSSTKSDNFDISSQTAQQLWTNGKSSANYTGTSGKNIDYSNTINATTVTLTRKRTITYINGKQDSISSWSYSKSSTLNFNKTITYNVALPTVSKQLYDYYNLNFGDYQDLASAKSGKLGITVNPTTIAGKYDNGTAKAIVLNVDSKNTFDFAFKFNNSNYGLPFNINNSTSRPTDVNYNETYSAIFNNGSKESTISHSKQNVYYNPSLHTGITPGLYVKDGAKSGISLSKNDASHNFKVGLNNDQTAGKYYYMTNGSDSVHNWNLTYSQSLMYKYGVDYSGIVTAKDGIENASIKTKDISDGASNINVTQPILYGVFKSVANNSKESIESKKVIIKTEDTDDDFDDSNKTDEWLWENGRTSSSYKYTTPYGDFNNSRTIKATIATISKITTIRTNANGTTSTSVSYRRSGVVTKSNTIKYVFTRPKINQIWYRPYDLNTNGIAADSIIKQEFGNFANAKGNLNLIINNNQNITNGDPIKMLDTNVANYFTVKFKTNYYGLPNEFISTGTPYPSYKNNSGGKGFNTSILNVSELKWVDNSSNGKFINGNGQIAINVNGKISKQLNFTDSTFKLSATTSSNRTSLSFNGNEVKGGNSASLFVDKFGGTFAVRAVRPIDFNLTNGSGKNWWTVNYRTGNFYNYGVSYEGAITVNGVGNASLVKEGVWCDLGNKSVTQPIIRGNFKADTVGGNIG